MATFPWAAFSEQANSLTTQLNGLGSATLSAASNELDNATNLDTHQVIEVTLATHTVVTPGYLEIYMIKAVDGTNYEDAPVLGGLDRNTLLCKLPVKAGTGAKSVMSKMLPLPPFKVKYYIGNVTGNALNASGNIMNVFTGTKKSV